MILRFVKNNIFSKPLRNILVLISVTLCVALMLTMVCVYGQINDNYSKSFEHYNIVLGATGSKTTLVLSSVFFNDVPSSTISYDYYTELENELHSDASRLYDVAPIAMGDEINGFNIVGTSSAFLSVYELKIGKNIAEYEDGKPSLVVGSAFASKYKVNLGDTFSGSHSHALEDDDSEEHHHHENFVYTVVGILEKTGTAVDNAVFTEIEAVWEVHGTDVDDGEKGNLCAVLISASGSGYLSLLNDERYFNDPNAMIVSVGDTLSGVMNVFGSASSIVLAVVVVVVVMSLNTLFLAMFTAAGERRRDVAVLRALGSDRAKILLTMLLEVLFMLLTSCLLGLLLSFGTLAVLRGVFNTLTGILIRPFKMYITELYVILSALAVGTAAGLIPSIKVCNTEPVDFLR